MNSSQCQYPGRENNLSWPITFVEVNAPGKDRHRYVPPKTEMQRAAVTCHRRPGETWN